MKKKDMVLMLMMIFLLLGCTGCVEEQTQEQTTSEMDNLTFRWYGFGINPPGAEHQPDSKESQWKTNWTINQTINAIIFMLEDEELVSLAVSRDVGVEQAALPLDSEKKYTYTLTYPYTDQSVEEYASNYMQSSFSVFYQNVSYLSNKTTTVNGINAYVTIFTFQWEHVVMKTKRIFIEKNGIIFLIDYSAPQELFDQYQALVDESIKSFTIQ